MNTLDYIRWRSDITMKYAPFNDVDNLIVGQIPYLDWEGVLDQGETMTLGQAWEGYCRRHAGEEIPADDLIRKDAEELISLCADSVRYRDIVLFDYVKEHDREQEKQFCALTMKLPDGTYYVSYEGTDTTILGWKENFNMSFMCPGPSQVAAAEYLKKQASARFRRFRVGGHSKGGNLAVYAAVTLNKPDKIIAVYNNDGPGFPDEFVKSGAYQNMKPKMKTFLPVSSVVGRLLNNETDVLIVHSNNNSLVWQHIPNNWEVEKDGVSTLSANSTESQFLQEVFNSWNNQLNYEQKVVFMNTIYDCMVSLGIRTSGELYNNPAQSMARIALKLRSYPEATRKTVREVIGVLMKCNVHTFYEQFLGSRIPLPRDLFS